MSDRFQVRELEGFPINLPIGDTTSSNNRPKLQTLVCDSWYCWRVVAAWDTRTMLSTPRDRQYAQARALAAERAAALNAEHGQAA